MDDGWLSGWACAKNCQSHYQGWPRSKSEQEDSTSWTSSWGWKTQQRLLDVKPMDGRCLARETFMFETIGLVMLTAAIYQTTTEREMGLLPLLQQDFLEHPSEGQSEQTSKYFYVPQVYFHVYLVIVLKAAIWTAMTVKNVRIKKNLEWKIRKQFVVAWPIRSGPELTEADSLSQAVISWLRQRQCVFTSGQLVTDQASGHWKQTRRHAWAGSPAQASTHTHFIYGCHHNQWFCNWGRLFPLQQGKRKAEQVEGVYVRNHCQILTIDFKYFILANRDHSLRSPSIFSYDSL